MNNLIIAAGLIFVIEGLLCFLAPGLIKRLAAQLQYVSEFSLRINGVVAVAIGVLLVWLIRG